MTTPRIVLCGVGALGSQALVLCRNFTCTWTLVDDDRVESKNLLGQAYVRQSVGKQKARALALQLRNFYGPPASLPADERRNWIEARPVRLGAHNARQLFEGAALVVDCFDNAESRRQVTASARALEVPLVHAAISGDGSLGMVRWDARFVADEEDTPGAATCEGDEHLPLIGVLTGTLARAIQDFLKEGAQRDSFVDLGGARETPNAALLAGLDD